MFIELLRNQKYEFWSKGFVRVAPEVTMLLESECSCISLHLWFLMSWSGRKVHLSILDLLRLLSLLSVAHLFSLGSLLFGSLISSLFLLALSPPLPAIHCIATSLQC